MLRVQRLAASVLGEVLAGRNLNQILAVTLESATELTPQQRGALQDLSYGTLRYYGQLLGLLQKLLKKPLRDLPVQYLLLVALYQLQYSKAAPYAIVDQAVTAVRQINPTMSGLANAVLRNFLRNREELLQALQRDGATRYAYPSWWVERLRQQYGLALAEKILLAGNQRPPLTLRVNSRQSSVADYMTELSAAGLAAEPIAPSGAILMAEAVPVTKLPGFFQGRVSVQDAGAQCAAGLLDVRDGMRVLDACAAPGGKAAHLLEMAEIELLALDVDAQRLTRVADNLQRLGLQAKLQVGDAARPNDWWDGRPFARILADVPCSASGVVKRHPDIKWLRRPSDMAGFAAQQARILDGLWPLLQRGGKLLYVTCSVFAEENEQVITAFLARHADAVLLPTVTPYGEVRLLPDSLHDGFFYALLYKPD